MTPRRIHCLFLFIALVTTSSAFADARAHLDSFARDLNALSGRFEQKVFNADASLRETSVGTLDMQAPRLFRWEYETPYQQLVVADGTHVWLYDVDLEQVTVRRQADEEAQSPLVVLTDPASLDQRYRVTEVGRDAGLDWLRLTPREEGTGFEFAELGLDAQGLQRMRMADGLGGSSEITFSGWQRNPGLSGDRFRFAPPTGVDLIGDVDSIGEVRPLTDDQ